MRLRITAAGGRPEWGEAGDIVTNWKYIDGFEIDLTPEQAEIVRLATSYPEWGITGTPA